MRPMLKCCRTLSSAGHRCVNVFLMRTIIVLFCASLVSLAADNGRLKTEIDPGRAGVFVDGKYVGPAANFKIPRTYEVSPGEHEVRLAEPRYEEIDEGDDLCGEEDYIEGEDEPVAPGQATIWTASN